MPDIAKLLPENRASGTGSPSLLGARGEKRRREFSERFGKYHPDIAGEFDRGVYGIGYGAGEPSAAPAQEAEAEPGEIIDPLTGKGIRITDAPDGQNSVFEMLGKLKGNTPEEATQNLEKLADEISTKESIREQLMRSLQVNSTDILTKLSTDLGDGFTHPVTQQQIRLIDLPAVRRQIQRIVEAMGLDPDKKAEPKGFFPRLGDAISMPYRDWKHGDPRSYEVPAESVSQETEDRRAKDWQDIQNKIYSDANYFRAGP